MMAQQPTPEQLKQYVQNMVEAVLAGADIDVAQLPVANGVALQQVANDLSTNQTDETVGRLRVALLVLGGADVLDAMQELLDLARSDSPSPSAAPGGLNGLLSGLGTPNIPPAAQHAFPQPDPATTAQPAAEPRRTSQTGGRRGYRPAGAPSQR